MATRDWPDLKSFAPRRQDGFAFTMAVAKSGFQAFYTGDVQSVSHASERLRANMALPPCSPADAGMREAFCTELVTTGDWVRLYHFLRPEPLGSLRGALVVQAAAAAGAWTVQISGATANGTLLAGDVLSANQQLLPVSSAGAVANGAGVVVVPLQRPLQRALQAGQPVQWSRAQGTFQLVQSEISFSYGSGGWQRPVTLGFREVLAL